jgi:hypothetical protein
MEIDEKILSAIERTEVVKAPRQNLATFGTTNIYYYLITQLVETANVIREGRVIASKPRIVTPTYLVNLEGFSGQAKRYIELMAEQNPQEPSIFYAYKNEPADMNIVSGTTEEVLEKIMRKEESSGNPLSAVIKGVEDMWDVSLMKFTFELTRTSVFSNVMDMERKGLFRMDNNGLPGDARNYIEELFRNASQDASQIPLLVAELKRWGVFAEYQDRFFSLFRK